MWRVVATRSPGRVPGSCCWRGCSLTTPHQSPCVWNSGVAESPDATSAVARSARFDQKLCLVNEREKISPDHQHSSSVLRSECLCVNSPCLVCTLSPWQCIANTCLLTMIEMEDCPSAYHQCYTESCQLPHLLSGESHVIHGRPEADPPTSPCHSILQVVGLGLVVPSVQLLPQLLHFLPSIPEASLLPPIHRGNAEMQKAE